VLYREPQVGKSLIPLAPQRKGASQIVGRGGSVGMPGAESTTPSFDCFPVSLFRILLPMSPGRTKIVWLLEYDSNLRPRGEQRRSTVVADLVALAKEPTRRLLNNGQCRLEVLVCPVRSSYPPLQREQCRQLGWAWRRGGLLGSDAIGAGAVGEFGGMDS